ncbi:MAG: flagellar motor protein [Acidimicrobiia bacterium]|nr:flagellar motor protein [Acidimicrobiia bacterium]
MDPISIVGVIFVLVGVFAGSLLKGVSPVAFFQVPAAFLIVIVASLGAGMVSAGATEVKSLVKLLLKSLKKAPHPQPGEVIGQIVSFAEQARREGLLALESQLGEVKDPFLQRGLQLAVDGVDSETVRDMMETEVRAMKERHKAGAKFMTSIGVFAPTFGIIGAVIGLIATLSHLDDPSKLGHGIAAAFIATFWGVFVANGIFLPAANKLARLSADEAAYKALIIEGVLSIQGGANPRTVGDLLRAYLPPAQVRKLDEELKSA